MNTVKLTAEGKIKLPEVILSNHHWETGIEFILEDTKEGLLIRPVKPFKPTTIKKVLGCTRYKGPAKNLEEMAAGIAKGIKERHARGRH